MCGDENAWTLRWDASRFALSSSIKEKPRPERNSKIVLRSVRSSLPFLPSKITASGVSRVPPIHG
jgi:hypothetical protein